MEIPEEQIKATNNSKQTGSWLPLGVKTPPASEFKSIEDVKNAFAAQLKYAIDLCAHKAEIKDQIIAEYYPLPLISSLTEGCLESGTDVTSGGAKYNHGCITNQALATVADSLTAIKWAVFDKKILSMDELLNHLHNNFDGAEDIRQQLINAPKYGNDDPYADDMALWVAKVYTDTVRSKRFWMGGVHRPCFISALSQTAEGTLCAATPDGRLAGVPVSNGLSPSNKADMNGMTATLHSGALASYPALSDGTALNITMNPNIIKTDEGLDKFTSTIEGYFDLGGRQVQFNPISIETLLDAQKHPGNYTGLNVKVSGFSMRFIDLPKDIQDDIIARTEYSAM
jgi:pyruvate-formate lyase